jgi:hypothetical protein
MGRTACDCDYWNAPQVDGNNCRIPLGRENWDGWDYLWGPLGASSIPPGLNGRIAASTPPLACDSKQDIPRQ